jgi:Cys-Gly metallodipeptidase DUG1
VTDLIQILATLVTPTGKILIPGLSDLIAPLTPEERARYEKINFSVADIDASTGSQSTISEDKTEVLMAKMREPSLSLHGIEGAFSAPGSKTVIPAAVTGKFSIRLVPDMLPDQIKELVEKHVHAEFSKLGSKNRVRLLISLIVGTGLYQC